MPERAARHLRQGSLGRPTLIAIVLGAGLVAFFATASVAAAVTIEGTTDTSTWHPSSTTIDSGESVTFKASSATPHGVAFNAGNPGTPSCTGVVGSPGQGNWEGNCTFTEPDVYAFHCTVHAAMTGTVTVNSTGPPPPTVTTGTGTPTSTTEATLQGTVNPNGVATEYFFNYGTTTNYGQVTGKTDAGSGTSDVAASTGVTGLTPGTTYHFQLVGETVSGPTKGVDHTFTTPGPPTTVIDTKPSLVTQAQSANFTFHSSPGGATEFDCKLDSGIFEACDSGAISYAGPLSEGGHSFEVKATDANGTGPVATWAWVVDRTGPTTTIGNPKPPTPNPGTSLTFKFSSNEPGTFECSLEGPDKAHAFSTCASDTGKTYANLASGSYTFKVRSTDLAGNQGSAASYAFTVDTSLSPPETSIVTKPPDPSGSTSADFTYSSTKAGSTFECKMDGEAFSPCPATGKSYAGLTPGSHTFEVRAKDDKNNPDPTPASYSFSVVFPVTPPEVKPPEVTPPPAPTAPDTKLTAKPKAKSKDKTPTFKFSATASGATFECQLDGKAFKACRSPLTTKPLKPGKHSFKVRAVGPSGLKDPSPAASSFKVVKPK
jgi:plastocyanin